MLSFSFPLVQNDVSGLLAYSLKVCMSLMQNKKFRNEVLRVLVKLYMNLEKPDFINVCQVPLRSTILLVANLHFNFRALSSKNGFMYRFSSPPLVPHIS